MDESCGKAILTRGWTGPKWSGEPLSGSGYTEYDHTFYLRTLPVPREWAGARRDPLACLLQKTYRVGCSIANPPVYMNDPFVQKHA